MSKPATGNQHFRHFPQYFLHFQTHILSSIPHLLFIAQQNFRLDQIESICSLQFIPLQLNPDFKGP